METLPIVPEFPLEVEYENYTIKSEFQNGVFQTRSQWPRSRRRWELVWHIATNEEAEVLQAFYREHKGAANPFYWTPGEKVPRPYAGPVLGQSAGGALGARTRYVGFSWASATAETTPSYVTTSCAVSSGYLLTATVPRFPVGVDRAWVYVGATAITLCKQATEITLTAGTWTEPTGGYDAGGAAPQTVNGLVETVTACFAEDSMKFTKGSGVAWSCRANLIEVW